MVENSNIPETMDESDDEVPKTCFGAFLKNFGEFFNGDIGPTNAGIIAYYDIRHFDFSELEQLAEESKKKIRSSNTEINYHEGQQPAAINDDGNILGSKSSLKKDTQITAEMRFNLLGGRKSKDPALILNGDPASSATGIGESLINRRTSVGINIGINIEPTAERGPASFQFPPHDPQNQQKGGYQRPVEIKKQKIAELKNLLSNPNAFEKNQVDDSNFYPRPMSLDGIPGSENDFPRIASIDDWLESNNNEPNKSLESIRRRGHVSNNNATRKSAESLKHRNEQEMQQLLSKKNLNEKYRKSLELLAKGALVDKEPELPPPIPPQLSFPQKSNPDLLRSFESIDGANHDESHRQKFKSSGTLERGRGGEGESENKGSAGASGSSSSTNSNSVAGSSDSGSISGSQQLIDRARTSHSPDVEEVIRDHLNNLMGRTQKWRKIRDQEKAKFFILHPRSRFMLVWTVILIMLILIDSIFIPIILAFPMADGINVLYIISYIVDGFYVFDMIIKFRTAVLYKTHFVDEAKVIAKIYLKNGLLMDILSVMPLDVVAVIFAAIVPAAPPQIPTDPDEFYVYVNPNDTSTSYLLPWLRLNRLIRLSRIFIYLNNQEIDLSIGTGYIRIKRYLLIILILIHGGACIWYLLACRMNPASREVYCSPQSWIAGGDDTVNSLFGKTYVSIYIDCLYYIVTTIASVGYGDITPRTSAEKLFAIIIVLCGVLLFGFIMGNVASSVSTKETARTEFQRKFNAIKEYMKAQNLPPELQQRVTAYYTHEWNYNKGMEKELYESLPPAFRGEVALAVNRAALEKVPFLRGCDEGVLKELALSMRPVTVLPNDFIIRRGSVGEEMYFIHGGSMEVVTKDGSAVAELGPGAFFGELALLFKTPRTASVRAVTHCDVFVLRESDLQQVIRNYPEIQRRIGSIAEERFEWYMGQRYVDTEDEFNGKLELSTRKEALKKVPLFKTCDKTFLEELSLTMRSIVYQPGDIIIEFGAIGTEMFFIHRGVVLVTSPDGSRVYAELGPGAYFGEVSLVYSVPRTAGVRAKTVCDLYVLFQSSFQKMLRENREVAEAIRNDAKRRYNFIQAQMIVD